MKTGKLVSFSEEELVDCVGWDKDQFSYFSPNGFMTTADYPYNLSAYKDQVCTRLGSVDRLSTGWTKRPYDCRYELLKLCGLRTLPFPAIRADMRKG
jgi:hypothetical protein